MTGEPDTAAAPSTALAERLVELVGALRGKGIPTGTSETVDAAAVIAVLGMDNRERLREGLAAALVRRGGQREVFDMLFDLHFPAALGARQDSREDGDELGLDELRGRLAAALAAHDEAALAQVAALAVDRLGQVGTEGTQTAGWSAYQALDRMQPQTLVASALEQRGRAGGSGQGQGHGQGQIFADRLARDEIRQDVERFRTLVAAEARRRTSEVRGRETVVRHAVRAGADRIDFLSASQQQLEELRRSVQPLARKLATRLAARRRRTRRGRIDIRRTLRRSMSTGGVPMDPVRAAPRPSRPEIVLLCDVSGSVSGFSGFTMHLVQALSSQFSRVRVFAFVNAMAEVTDLVRDARLDDATDDLAARIASSARITKWHTSSDYGEAFADFLADHLDAIGPRTSVLVLGDARNNNQDPHLDALHVIAQRARAVFWLNPESQVRWGLGDSVAPAYGSIVPMHECCNVDQLAGFITRLLPV